MRAHWLVAIGLLFGAALGAAATHWWWSSHATALALMDAVTKIELNAKLLEQERTGDRAALASSLRSLIGSGGAALDVIAPAGSVYASDPAVVEARKKVEQLRRGEADS